MESDALPEPIAPDPVALAAAGLDAAEISVMRRVLSSDRDDDRPWFNIFMEARDG